MGADITETLAQRLDLSRERVVRVCELLDSGLSPVFIAHFRKGAVGALDDAAIRGVAALRRELQELEDLRRRVLRQMEEAGRPAPAAAGSPPPPPAILPPVTDDVRCAVAETDQAEVLEDLLRLYRPKRRTAGVVALERGLGPLADYARAGPADGPDLLVKAAEFVSAPKEVRSAEDALAGASHILAERASDDFAIRQALRRVVWDHGILKSQQAKGAGKQAAEFRGYFQFQEALNRLPPHRVLAVNRGERSKALKVTIEVPPEALKADVLPPFAPAGHRFQAFLESVLADALQRLLLPAIDREIRRQLTLRAEDHAIGVFASNLRSLLMARPLGGKRVLAVQPGFRTGSKVAVLDRDGSLLGETILYPLEPQKKWAEAKNALVAEIQRHGVNLIAIGNGTGCREIEALVSETIEEHALTLEYAIISEAGAAVYADSDLGKQEFPNIEAALRATVSIGRRIQDPLAELVKIDPRAIGVGLYQHDVNQERLRQALDETVESCVAAVGADANTASPAMLRHVPGLGAAEVQALVARRAASPLAGRAELATLPGWTDRTFQTAVGFLRVSGENPLDAIRIHPESYPSAERLLACLGHTVADLRSPDSAKAVRDAFTGLPLEPLAAELQVALLDLMDLVAALQQPGLDPRSQHHGPILRTKMRRLEDLAPGMWVKGTVRNVVDFGAFVDIGLKEDGLIHISQFSRRYVRNPLKFLHVGDVLEVRIVSIEADKHRIALTLISEEPPRKREPRPAPRRTPPPGGPTSAAGADAPSSPAGPPSAPRSSAPRGRGTDGAAPRRAAPADRRGAPGSAPAQRRPPRRDQPQAPAGAAAAATPHGPRPGLGHGPRPPRTDGAPRVIVSKSAKPAAGPGVDEQGRPRLRWAYYDSDLRDDETEALMEAPEPEAEPQASPAPPAEADAQAEPPPAQAAQPATPAAPAPAEAGPDAAPAATDEAPGPDAAPAPSAAVPEPPAVESPPPAQT